MRPPRYLPPAVLALTVLAGVVLRLWPTVHPPGTHFLGDGAAIARLALASAPSGRMPSVDSLAEAPAGRRLGPVLAPGLIVSLGTFYRWMAAAGSRDTVFDLALFGALCGGLIAVPVYLWARVAWGPGWAAPFAAVAIAFLPAHLHRTFGYFLRYDAAGSLLVTSHLAAFAAALAESRPLARRIWAGVAALLLFAALWMWRVPLVLPLLEAAAVSLMVLLRGSRPETRDAFPVMVLLVTPGLFALEYLRSQHFALSFSWLAVLAIAVVLWVQRLASGRARVAERAAWLAAALAIAFAISRLTAAPSPYSAAAGLLPIKLKMLLHVPVSPSPAERLLLSIEELATLAPAPLLVGAMNLGFLGPWLLLAPAILWFLAGRPGIARLAQLRSDHLLIGVIALAFALLTVLVYRTKVLLAPLVAVVAAGALQALLAPRAATAPARGRHRANAKPTSTGTRAMLAAILCTCVFGNLWLSVVIARTRDSRLEADFLAAASFLREKTPPRATVATLWAQGYEVQTYAGRPTPTDAFLESGLVSSRMGEFSRAALQRSPDSLAAWCRRLGARWLLVPPSTQLLSVVTLASDPIEAKLRASQPLSPEEADRTLVRMMVYGRDEPPFTRAFESGLWRVYLLPDPGASADPLH